MRLAASLLATAVAVAMGASAFASFELGPVTVARDARLDVRLQDAPGARVLAPGAPVDQLARFVPTGAGRMHVRLTTRMPAGSTRFDAADTALQLVIDRCDGRWAPHAATSTWRCDGTLSRVAGPGPALVEGLPLGTVDDESSTSARQLRLRLQLRADAPASVQGAAARLDYVFTAVAVD